MQIFRQLQPVSQLFPDIVLTMGNFDGLHLGHKAILSKVNVIAKELGGTPAVFTFESHPLCLLNPANCPTQLTTLEERLVLFAQEGMKLTLCIPFTHELANLTAEQFLAQVIAEFIRPRRIVVGYDFAFGKNRGGDIHLLWQMQERYGYKVSQVKAVKVGGDAVCSTLIRQKIANGEVGQARLLLGRPYSISGQVVTGKQRGTGLGFPTANLSQTSKQIPKPGVYAVRVEWTGKLYPGVANIGYKPTFGGDNLEIEVHLLDFKQDIYGENINICFIERLRDEQKFSGLDQLKAQIAQDCSQARQVFRSFGLFQAES